LALDEFFAEHRGKEAARRILIALTQINNAAEIPKDPAALCSR